MEQLQLNTEGKIITIFPVAGGNGASYTAVNLAYALREKDPYKKIAIADFDFAHPFLGAGLTADTVHGIDNLVDKLNGDFLDNELFMENMIKLRENIDLLRGTQLGRFNLVKQDHLKKISEFLKEEYDVVIIVTNHAVTDGGTAVGLYVADHTLVIGRYNAANALLAQKTVDAVRTYGGKGDVGVLYNFYQNQNGIDFSEVFEDWPIFGTLPYLPDTVDNQHLISKGLSPMKKRKNATQDVYEQIIQAFAI